MDELFFNVHDNYYSFDSDDPPPKAEACPETSSQTHKGLWMCICK